MGIEVAIATPGRMNDLLEMGCIDLSKVQFLVLDEADRM
jgi:superfamily II DNA/RNA helicase